MDERKLRIVQQGQSGLFAAMRPKAVRMDIPGEFTGNAKMYGVHTISHGSPIAIRKQSHQVTRYYDPAHDGQRSVVTNTPIQAPQAPVIIQEEEELNLQGFQMKEKMDVMNPFADIGIVYEDENVTAESEGEEGVKPQQGTEATDEAPSLLDPNKVYEDLLGRTSKNFGITREELASFGLTTNQVKNLFIEVTGKSANNVAAGKQKRRVRDVAAMSFSDYTRVINALTKVLNK
jgi:hypothetical protein